MPESNYTETINISQYNHIKIEYNKEFIKQKYISDKDGITNITLKDMIVNIEIMIDPNNEQDINIEFMGDDHNIDHNELDSFNTEKFSKVNIVINKPDIKKYERGIFHTSQQDVKCSRKIVITPNNKTSLYIQNNIDNLNIKVDSNEKYSLDCKIFNKEKCFSKLEAKNCKDIVIFSDENTDIDYNSIGNIKCKSFIIKDNNLECNIKGINNKDKYDIFSLENIWGCMQYINSICKELKNFDVVSKKHIDLFVISFVSGMLQCIDYRHSANKNDQNVKISSINNICYIKMQNIFTRSLNKVINTSKMTKSDSEDLIQSMTTIPQFELFFKELKLNSSDLVSPIKDRFVDSQSKYVHQNMFEKTISMIWESFAAGIKDIIHNYNT